MDGLALALKCSLPVRHERRLPAAVRARSRFRHPGHDEHHQSRPRRTDDARRLYGNIGHSTWRAVSDRCLNRLRRGGRLRAIFERLVVQRFYGRELGALVVTWGISLILAQGALLLLGPFMPSSRFRRARIAFGQYSFSGYWLGLMVVCVVVIALLWWLYNRTTFGLQARAVMQNPVMASALGVNTRWIYMLTFSLEPDLPVSAARCLLRPRPSCRSWASSSWRAFITVVVGGATSSSGPSARACVPCAHPSDAWAPFFGLVALLLAALIIIRLMPDGISGYLQKLHDRRTRFAYNHADLAPSHRAEDIGQTVWFWLGFAGLIGFFLYYPAIITEFEASNLAFYLLNIPLALGSVSALGLLRRVEFRPSGIRWDCSLHLRHHRRQYDRQPVGAARRCTLGGLAACALVDLWLFRLLCPRADMDRADHAGLHPTP